MAMHHMTVRSNVSIPDAHEDIADGVQTAELHASHTRFMSFVADIAAELVRRSMDIRL